ncbi:MAG: hypothetical protein IPG00_22100 [Saprospiraceae bacterium]|nr:hypothetical protein [Saprospiraceae bacterium]
MKTICSRVSMEYLMVQSAPGLPTKLGQKLVVKRTTSSDLIWESLDMKEAEALVWESTHFIV